MSVKTAEYYRKWRLNHPEQVRTIWRKRRGEARDYVRRVKSAPCTDCGNTFPPECMDFDHVSEVKNAAVTSLSARGASRQRIDAEIALCELVCSNCHRIRTERRRCERLKRKSR